MSEERFVTSAQEAVLVEAVDEILSKVFQGQKEHLREHMLGVVAKLSRKHPWPFFEECVAAEVAHRASGGEPREYGMVIWQMPKRPSSLAPRAIRPREPGDDH